MGCTDPKIAMQYQRWYPFNVIYHLYLYEREINMHCIMSWKWMLLETMELYIITNYIRALIKAKGLRHHNAIRTLTTRDNLILWDQFVFRPVLTVRAPHARLICCHCVAAIVRQKKFIKVLVAFKRELFGSQVDACGMRSPPPVSMLLLWDVLLTIMGCFHGLLWDIGFCVWRHCAWLGGSRVVLSIELSTRILSFS